MASGSTYTALATQTLGTAASSVTFSSIPQGYTDLRIVFNGTSAAAGDLYIQFNGDTGSNYSVTNLYGNGSSASSNRASNTTVSYNGTTSTNLGIVISDVMNYSNATTYKTTLNRASNANYEVQARVSLWRNTAAITSMLIQNTGGKYHHRTAYPR